MNRVRDLAWQDMMEERSLRRWALEQAIAIYAIDRTAVRPLQTVEEILNWVKGTKS